MTFLSYSQFIKLIRASAGYSLIGVASILMVAAVFIASNSQAHAIAADGFACNPDLMYISRTNLGTGDVYLDSTDVTAATPTFTNILAPGNLPNKANGLAYEPNDGYFYMAWNDDNNTNLPGNEKGLYVQKNDSNPAALVLDMNDAISAFGYPELNVEDPASAIYSRVSWTGGDIYDNHYYALYAARTDNTPAAGQRTFDEFLIKIDLTPTTPTITSVVKMSYASGYTIPAGTFFGGTRASDFVIDPMTEVGYMYDRIAKRIMTLDITNGVASPLAIDYEAISDLIGDSIALMGNGDLYLFGTNDATATAGQDTLYIVDKTTGEVTARSSTATAFEETDGTACTVTDGALTFTKSVDKTSLVPGDVVTFTYVIDSTYDAETFTSLVLADALPTGLTYVDGSLTVDGSSSVWSASAYAGASTIRIDGLVVGPEDLRTITVQAVVDDDAAELSSFTNEAQLAGVPAVFADAGVISTSDGTSTLGSSTALEIKAVLAETGFAAVVAVAAGGIVMLLTVFLYTKSKFAHWPSE